jgi:hypothetical protein
MTLHLITTNGWTYPSVNEFSIIWPIVGMGLTLAIIIAVTVVIARGRKKPDMKKKLIAGVILAVVSLILLIICGAFYVSNKKTADNQLTFSKINFSAWVGAQGYHMDSPQLNTLYSTKKVQYDTEVITLKLDTASNTYVILESK